MAKLESVEKEITTFQDLAVDITFPIDIFSKTKD